MTEVTITLNTGFKGDLMRVHMCGKIVDLTAGESAVFPCENGRRRITVEILTSKTGLISYRLDFSNAQRWNGNRYVQDKIFGGEIKAFYVYVPGVRS